MSLIQNLEQAFTKLSSYTYPIESEDDYKNADKAKSELLTILSKINISEDIYTVFTALQLSIMHNILFFNEQEEAIKEAQRAKEAIDNVFDKKIYETITLSFSSYNKDKDNFPIEIVRDFIARCQRKIIFNLTYPRRFFVEINLALIDTAIKAEELYIELQRDTILGKKYLISSKNNPSPIPQRKAIELTMNYRITPLQIQEALKNIVPYFEYEQLQVLFNFLYANKEAQYMEIEALVPANIKNSSQLQTIIPKLPLIFLYCLQNSINDLLDKTYYFVDDIEFFDNVELDDPEQMEFHRHLIQYELTDIIRDLQKVTTCIQEETGRLIQA